MVNLSALKALQGTQEPVGMVKPYAGSTAPSGYLVLDGTTLDSVANPEYAALFAVIGTTYGGTGADDFNLPDLRARFLRGVDSSNSQGVGTKNLGTSEGQATARNGLGLTWSSANASSNTTGNHTHSFTRFSGAASGASGSIRVVWNNYANQTTGSAGNHSHTVNKNQWNSNQSWAEDTETRPLSLTMNYIIKY